MNGAPILPSRLFAIVVGLDFHDSGYYAFGQAARIAKGIPSCQIHLLHVSEEDLTAERRRDLVGTLRTYVNDKAKSIGGVSGVTIGVHLRAGAPAREIVQLSSDVSASLIVLGSRKGPHLKSWLLGSVTDKVLATAPCPVLISGPRPEAVKHEPAIEPPCADCVRERAETGGTTFWCKRHAARSIHAHTYSYQRDLPLAFHDSEVIPTGVDFETGKL